MHKYLAKRRIFVCHKRCAKRFFGGIQRIFFTTGIMSLSFKIPWSASAQVAKPQVNFIVNSRTMSVSEKNLYHLADMLCTTLMPKLERAHRSTVASEFSELNTHLVPSSRLNFLPTLARKRSASCPVWGNDYLGISHAVSPVCLFQ